MRAWLITLSALSGLFGAAGVALAAVGAHRVADPRMTTAAYFLLFHASALVAFCAAAHVARSRLVLAAASLVGMGALLFSGDLALRAWSGLVLIRMAAPAGGMLMIVGWAMATLVLPLALGADDRQTNQKV